MENVNQDIENIIDRMNEGSALTSEERQELSRWAALSPDNAARLHDEAEISAAAEASAGVAEIDADAAFDRFLSRIHEYEAEADEAPRRHHRIAILAAAAAVAALMVLTGICAFRMGADRQPAYGMLMAAAPAGSTATVTLPDGTTVNLNSGSRIAYSQDFGITNRDIRLDGQGYFDVKHNDDMPMCVTTPHAIVSDLGTAFDLCDYSSELSTMLTVADGAAAIAPITGGNGTQHTVRAGQTARLDATTGRVKITSAATETPYQWRTAKVRLTGQSMNEIADILNRAYGATVIIKSRRAAKMHFNGEFNLRVCSLTDVLEALATTNKISYSVKGSVVEIR